MAVILPVTGPTGVTADVLTGWIIEPGSDHPRLTTARANQGEVIVLVTKKAHEGDLVELAEDLPKYGLKQGQRGNVIEAFDEPNEAYDIEFEDENGEFIGFGYSVKPNQIITFEKRKRKANLLDVVEVVEDDQSTVLRVASRG